MKNLILTIVTLLLVCCGEVEATNNTTNEVIKPVVRKVYTHPVEINLDDMTSTNAFRVQYLAKGGVVPFGGETANILPIWPK